MKPRIPAATDLSTATQAVLAQQLDAMAAEAGNSQASVASRIHAVRVHTKHIRALLKLLPESATTAATKTWVQRTARLFSAARDARVAQQCAEQLAPGSGDEASLPDWLEQLSAHHEALARPHLDALPAAIAEQQGWLQQHPLPHVSLQQLREALHAGKRKIQRARQRAVRKGGSTRFHRWRKACKRGSLQGLLLEDLLPQPEQPHWHRMQQLLGDEHDCTIVLVTLKQAPDRLQPESQRLRRAARQQRKALRRRALQFDPAKPQD